VRERLSAFPELSIARLLREIRELGYPGGKTALGDFVRAVRPAAAPVFEVRFETEPGQQAQVDFAHFKVVFDEQPGVVRVVWLFSMVLGHSRYLFARFCLHQDLQTLLRLHIEAFEHFAGVPRQILYDRMKSAVLGEGEDQHIVYNASLLALASHYGFAPRACKAYRAKTKGKVERPFRYIRQDFFLGGHFANLEDLNAQLERWLSDVANARVHGTTDRVVAEHFAQGMVSVGGNLLQRARWHTLARARSAHARPRDSHLRRRHTDGRTPGVARVPPALVAARTPQAATPKSVGRKRGCGHAPHARRPSRNRACAELLRGGRQRLARSGRPT
jgi:transposase